MTRIPIRFFLFLATDLLAIGAREASAQTPHHMQIQNQTQTQTQRIAIYCKVWGFIKYHHQNVAAGIIDWDSVFIAHIGPVIAGGGGAALNTELSSLIQ